MWWITNSRDFRIWVLVVDFKKRCHIKCDHPQNANISEENLEVDDDEMCDNDVESKSDIDDGNFDGLIDAINTESDLLSRTTPTQQFDSF